MTPTESGWYWWTRTSPVNAGARMGDDDWIPSPPGVPVVLYVGLSCATVAFPGCEIDILFLMCCLHGVWGERIPSSDRLEAMRELAAHQALCFDSDGTPHCVHCGCVLGKHSEPHGSYCAWMRAQPKRTRADFDAFLKSVIEANEAPGQTWAIRTSRERLLEIGFTDEEIDACQDERGWCLESLLKIWHGRKRGQAHE